MHPIPHLLCTAAMLFALLYPAAPRAALIDAGPDDYVTKLGRLKPGDTLQLAPGEYRRGLRLHQMAGTPAEPIVIRGPAGGQPAAFIARRGANTVSLQDVAYIHIRDLTLDGRNLSVDAVKLEGTARFGHHILLENLRITGHGAGQLNIGISTKAPAWGWIIRGNRIHGAGTGMYLGNSDGSAPFFDGVIEYNLVTAPIGYAIQIKHQMPRPPLDGMPRGRHVTIIRHNVLSKTEGGSTGRDAQPNLLLGHWPLSGEGMTDEYHVYGNFLDGNPNEALFQAEGNVAFYANVLRNRQGPGIVIMPHNDVPREIRIFGNTIVTSGRPISVRVNSRTPEKRQFVFGNLIYSPLPIRGGVQSGNAVFPLEADAGNLLNYMNPAPAARCPSPDDAWIREATDAGCDFNGQPRTTGQCGAYSGSSRSPGWTPTLDIKPRTQCRIR